MSRFKKATRRQARLRMALDGPAGSGKSFTALRFAFSHPDESVRVACIEAGENGGLSLYLGNKPDERKFDFDLLELTKNFSPMEYVNAIEDAGKEGYDILIIDSLSHAWSGQGGALEQVGASGFTDKDGWRKVTPQHNRLVDAILQSPCHIICTMRTKTEYVIDEDSSGRKSVKKIGMAPIQRAGMEYEFTVYGNLDHSHTLTISKSRCDLIQDAIVFKPTGRFMTPVWEWLETGEASNTEGIVKRIGSEDYEKITRLLNGVPTAKVKNRLMELYGVGDLILLTQEQAKEMIDTLEKKKREDEAAKAAKNAAVSTNETVQPV